MLLLFLPHPISLILIIFFELPITQTVFRFPLKGPAIENQLYLQTIKYIKLKMVGVFHNVVVIIVNDII